MIKKMTHAEPHMVSHQSRLNWLRAGVLGADDGIVSVAGLVVGVAGATNSVQVILAAGLAGIIAGAISMAAGEYVSVSSQRDTEKALLEQEQYELKTYPKEELKELAKIYEKKGLKKATAMTVAKELTAHDAMAAHFDAELGIDPNDLTNPWQAAIASALSFLAGALIPMFAIMLPSASARISATFISVIIALAITGIISAKISRANPVRATVRVVVGGVIAMMVTYMIGRLFHVSGI